MEKYPFCIELEQKAISLEKVLRDIGYHGKKLYPSHIEKNFRRLLMKEEKHWGFNLKSLYSVCPHLLFCGWDDTGKKNLRLAIKYLALGSSGKVFGGKRAKLCFVQILHERPIT